MPISKEQVEQVVAFHGHLCPGLAIGIRAAEAALQAMQNPAQDEELVAVVENDNCSVDAIQFLTGCTFGKGNFIFRDYGKNVYSFYRRVDGKSIRILLKSDAGKHDQPEVQPLLVKQQNGDLTAAESSQLDAYRQERIERILNIPLDDLFEIQPISGPIPQKAHLYESLRCAHCGETTMETRTRRIHGEWLCLPCYEAVERKI